MSINRDASADSGKVVASVEAAVNALQGDLRSLLDGLTAQSGERSDSELMYLRDRCLRLGEVVRQLKMPAPTLGEKSKLLLLSSSSYAGDSDNGFLNFGTIGAALGELFKGASKVLFFPFAKVDKDFDGYTEVTRNVLRQFGIEILSAHSSDDLHRCIEEAEGFFIGGGNTTRLLNRLYHEECMEVLRKKVEEGVPFAGSSAGAAVAGASIGTTNDMNVADLVSFMGLGLVPFAINPHYPLQGRVQRDKKLSEHEEDNPHRVLYCPMEGSWLEVVDGKMFHRGEEQARIKVPRLQQ